MEKGLLLVLDDVKKKINKFYDGRKRDKYNNQIDQLKQDYSSIEIEERHEETYNSLINKGKELLKENNIKDEKKVTYYLRYCGAAEYDFRNNMKPLNLIMKSFLLTCALFMVLGPQYLGVVLPLVFIVPIFMGLKGMRQRVLNGLMMGVSVVPMGVLVSVIWIRNVMLAASNFGGFVAGIAQQYHLPIDLTQNLVIACVIMSIVLLCSSITLLYAAIKHRKMFV